MTQLENAQRISEETPLLPGNGVKKPTLLPMGQISIVVALQLVEPFTSNIIYPFAPQLIRDLGVTKGQESRVGYHVGLMQSIFYLTQACTVLQWSRISDNIGRKPVILTGLFGLALSMYSFGLSTTFWGAVISRCLNGALNGNIGVIKNMMAEMTDSTNLAKAYGIMPIAWATGGTLGPMIGGSLSHPAKQFPHLFGHIQLLKDYPYLLPCAVPATFSLIAWIVTLFFLKETVPHTISLKEYLGFKKEKINFPDEDERLVSSGSEHEVPESERPVPFRRLLNRRIIIAAGNYATLSLVDISFRAIQPVFLSTPIHLGGLGLQPPTIGKLLAMYGILNGMSQIFFFARANERFGSKNVFVFGISLAFICFSSFPLINYLARHQGYSPLVWTMVVTQMTLAIALNFAYGAVFIFITLASPNRASLGATNGLSQMTVSVMRAIGPAVANSLFSLSIGEKYLGEYLVYYVLNALVLLSIGNSLLLPRLQT